MLFFSVLIRENIIEALCIYVYLIIIYYAHCGFRFSHLKKKNKNKQTVIEFNI